ncbi:MAG: hypothetical protein WC736_15060 [Gallionella sp.]|jgi:hypothetical protein
MFTVKIIYASGATNILPADEVYIGNMDSRLSLKRGDKMDEYQFDGSETVYIENSAGKTVHMLRCGRVCPVPPSPDVPPA